MRFVVVVLAVCTIQFADLRPVLEKRHLPAHAESVFFVSSPEFPDQSAGVESRLADSYNTNMITDAHR